MKRLAAAAVAFASLTLGTAAFAAPTPVAAPARRPANADEEVRQLHREIAATKLDKALNLTRDQARAMLPLLQEGARQLELQRAEHETRAPAIAKALLAVKEDLKRDGLVSEASKKALKEARGDEGTKAVHEHGRELREKAKAILTAEQLKAFREFNPAPLQGEKGEHAGKGEHGWDRGGEGEGGPHHGRRGHAPARMAMITLSPEFIALVQARAK